MAGSSQRFFSFAGLVLMGLSGAILPAKAQQPASDIPVTAQLTIRLSELEAQIRQLTGQVEDLSATVTQLRQRLERQASDTDFRLNELEKTKRSDEPPLLSEQQKLPDSPQPTPPGAPPRDLGSISASSPVFLSQPSPPAGSPPPDAPSKTSTTKEAYDQAFALIQKQDYPGAETAFRAFLSAHGNDELAGNAQYWLGETFYVRGNYREAAAQFFQGYQKYPKNNKAPDNLLKLGLSLVHVNKIKEACAAFNRFNGEYPQAPAFLKRRVQEERARNACGP